MSLTGIKTQPLLRGNLFTMSQWQSLFARGSWRVYPYQLGCMVRSSSTGTDVLTDGLGQFLANDYLMACTATAYGSGTLYVPQTSKVALVSAVSSSDDALTVSPALTLAEGDWLLNLGPDTGTTAPVYDGTRCRIKTDPAGNTASSTLYAATATNGQFQGWITDAFGDPAFLAVDLLVTNSSGTPQAVLPLYPLGPAIS